MPHTVPRMVLAVVVLLRPLAYCASAQELPLQATLQAGGADVCNAAGDRRSIDLAEAVTQALQSQPQLVAVEQDVIEARADLKTARAAFLPEIQFFAEDERYVPSNGASPVVVVGNSVLGGPEVRSAYSSLSLNWNLMSSGRDLAAVHGAQASIRAASDATQAQLADSMMGVLQAYGDLYEAEITARNASRSLTLLKSIQSRAEERYENGHGTTVAIGQARVAALDAEQTLNHECRAISDKTAALSQAIGTRVPVLQGLSVGGPLPTPLVDLLDQAALDDVVEGDPIVAASREKLAAARAKQQQAVRAFGPTVSLSVRRDYLGQDLDSFGYANHHIAPNDYRVDLSFQQPLFPLMSESAAVDKARAEVRRAQAAYDQARLETDAKLRGALAGRREAEASYLAARSSLESSSRVLELTRSLYRAGRTDLDNVEHAQIDRDKAESDVQTLASKQMVAAWAATRAMYPAQFPDVLFRQLHIQASAQTHR